MDCIIAFVRIKKFACMRHGYVVIEHVKYMLQLLVQLTKDSVHHWLAF